MNIVFRFNKKNQKAFTLAEVLVSLFLVGVAAMMMLPVVKTIKPSENLIELWKKDFTMLAQAYSNAKNDIVKENSDEEVSPLLISSDDLIEEMKKYLNIAQDCGDSEYICGSNPKTKIGNGEENVYKTLTGAHFSQDDLSDGQLLLKDGANIYLGHNVEFISTLWVDVNGFRKGPNVLGKDLFGVIVFMKGVIPMGASGTSAKKTGSNCDKTDSYVPIVDFDAQHDYAGASCSLTKLMTK